MARSRLTETTKDLISDGGSILWSLVKGEQLEFPITLNFIEDASVKASNNYNYEAVVVEALNVAGQSDVPTSVRPNGVSTTLFVRLPRYIGVWSASSAYNKEEVVLYNGVYYKLLKGAGRISSILPSEDSLWQITQLNKIYVQFPTTLGSTWTVQPIVDTAVYGFFELRVTEPTDQIFTRTFKPVRGMVELLFSPTDSVVDSPNQTVL